MPMMTMMVPALGGVVGRQYQGVFGLRKARIELAERMYEVENGRKAERLEDLVPKFLREVPKDTVTGGGVAMQTRALRRAIPVLLLAAAATSPAQRAAAVTLPFTATVEIELLTLVTSFTGSGAQLEYQVGTRRHSDLGLRVSS